MYPVSPVWPADSASACWPTGHRPGDATDAAPRWPDLTRRAVRPRTPPHWRRTIRGKNGQAGAWRLRTMPIAMSRSPFPSAASAAAASSARPSPPPPDEPAGRARTARCAEEVGQRSRGGGWRPVPPDGRRGPDGPRCRPWRAHRHERPRPPTQRSASSSATNTERLPFGARRRSVNRAPRHARSASASPAAVVRRRSDPDERHGRRHLTTIVVLTREHTCANMNSMLAGDVIELAREIAATDQPDDVRRHSSDVVGGGGCTGCGAGSIRSTPRW